MKLKKNLFFGGGGGSGWGVREDVNKESFCENSQGRCECRSVFFVKIQKNIFFLLGGGGGSGWGGGAVWLVGVSGWM